MYNKKKCRFDFELRELGDKRAKLTIAANEFSSCLPFDNDIEIELTEETKRVIERDERYMTNLEKLEVLPEYMYETPIQGGTWEVDQDEILESKGAFASFFSRRKTSKEPLTDIMLELIDYDQMGGGHSDPDVQDELGILNDGFGGPKLQVGLHFFNENQEDFERDD